MKISKLILFAIFALIFIASCDKNENNSKKTLERETLSAKWVVSNSSEYASFEFNSSSNFIVVEKTTSKSANEQMILFGTYEIIDNKTIVLSDFGTLTVSDIDENSISFSIKLTSNPNNEIIINALKQVEMESSTKTDLLCRTWELMSINGDTVVGTENGAIVLFSKAGTYYVTYSDGEGGLAQWKWKDELETQFLFSWEEVPVWAEADYVEIVELTNSTLKILEEFPDGNELFVLEPIGTTKSSKISSSETTPKTVRKGFLRK